MNKRSPIYYISMRKRSAANQTVANPSLNAPSTAHRSKSVPKEPVTNNDINNQAEGEGQIAKQINQTIDEVISTLCSPKVKLNTKSKNQIIDKIQSLKQIGQKYEKHHCQLVRAQTEFWSTWDGAINDCGSFSDQIISRIPSRCKIYLDKVQHFIVSATESNETEEAVNLTSDFTQFKAQIETSILENIFQEQMANIKRFREAINQKYKPLFNEKDGADCDYTIGRIYNVALEYRDTISTKEHLCQQFDNYQNTLLKLIPRVAPKPEPAVQKPSNQRTINITQSDDEKKEPTLYELLNQSRMMRNELKKWAENKKKLEEKVEEASKYNKIQHMRQLQQLHCKKERASQAPQEAENLKNEVEPIIKERDQLRKEVSDLQAKVKQAETQDPAQIDNKISKLNDGIDKLKDKYNQTFPQIVQLEEVSIRLRAQLRNRFPVDQRDKMDSKDNRASMYYKIYKLKKALARIKLNELAQDPKSNQHEPEVEKEQEPELEQEDNYSNHEEEEEEHRQYYEEPEHAHKKTEVKSMAVRTTRPRRSLIYPSNKINSWKSTTGIPRERNHFKSIGLPPKRSWDEFKPIEKHEHEPPHVEEKHDYYTLLENSIKSYESRYQAILDNISNLQKQLNETKQTLLQQQHEQQTDLMNKLHSDTAKSLEQIRSKASAEIDKCKAEANKLNTQYTLLQSAYNEAVSTKQKFVKVNGIGPYPIEEAKTKLKQIKQQYAEACRDAQICQNEIQAEIQVMNKEIPAIVEGRKKMVDWIKQLENSLAETEVKTTVLQHEVNFMKKKKENPTIQDTVQKKVSALSKQTNQVKGSYDTVKDKMIGFIQSFNPDEKLDNVSTNELFTRIVLICEQKEKPNV